MKIEAIAWEGHRFFYYSNPSQKDGSMKGFGKIKKCNNPKNNPHFMHSDQIIITTFAADLAPKAKCSSQDHEKTHTHKREIFSPFGLGKVLTTMVRRLTEKTVYNK